MYKEPTFETRSNISNGALESIKEFLASRNSPVTVNQVAEIYPDQVSWAVDKNARGKGWNWRPEARKWAHDHLQYLNRSGNRSVLTKGKHWWLATTNVSV